MYLVFENPKGVYRSVSSPCPASKSSTKIFWYNYLFTNAYKGIARVSSSMASYKRHANSFHLIRYGVCVLPGTLSGNAVQGANRLTDSPDPDRARRQRVRTYDGESKYVYVQKEISYTKIRMDSTTARRRSMGSPRLKDSSLTSVACCLKTSGRASGPHHLTLRPGTPPKRGNPVGGVWGGGCFTTSTMAFEPSTRLYACAACDGRFRFFKLMDVNRLRAGGDEEPEEKDGERTTHRVCAGCELQIRLEEWAIMTPESREGDPDYATEKRVHLDMKRRNKGRAWNAQAGAMQKAKQEIIQEDEKKELTAKRRKRAVLERARRLAEAVLNAFKSGGMLKCLSTAGERISAREELFRNWDNAYDAFVNDPTNVEKREECERCEQAYEEAGDYTTMAEAGDMQSAYLKALDFADILAPGLRIFNVCRARTAYDDKGCSCSCGLAFPAKMWRKLEGRWKFTCNVDWTPLVKEAEKCPEDMMLNGWVTDLKGKYGEDLTQWPKIGCGNGFVPWKKGASMVVEVQLADKSWTSFMSERLPQELDDEIKKHYAAFYKAAEGLTPEDLQEAIPMGFPMTHLLDEFPCLARYPIDEWEKSGAPMMTVKSWCKLCMRVARNNLSSLESIFELAQKIHGPEEPKGTAPVDPAPVEVSTASSSVLP